MKKIFIVIIAIIAIMGIYFAIKKPPVEAPTVQEQTQSSSSAGNVSSGMEGMISEQMMSHEQSSVGEKVSKNVINYTDKGFIPSTLEIKSGETVQFVNQSNGGMWVASGPHPTHTGYPGFDAKKAIPNGGSYEFAFTKVGEWKFHNHLKESAFGTIIVK